MSKSVLIITDTYGAGDEKLGRVLMHNFLYSLARSEELPQALLFANSGVRLVCDGADSLESLRLMEKKDVVIKACGTCLDFYGLMDKLAVGEVGTMPGSVATLMGDSSIVTIA